MDPEGDARVLYHPLNMLLSGKQILFITCIFQLAGEIFKQNWFQKNKN